MTFRRISLIAVAALALAAPVFAGEHIELNPGAEGTAGAGGVTTPALNVLILDQDTAQPISGASGTLWSIPKHSWESPQIVDTALSGLRGYFYFTATGYKGGDVFTLDVSAPNYSPYSTLIWLTKANTTTSEVDLAVVQASGKQGVPSAVKGVVSSTWGKIKALY